MRLEEISNFSLGFFCSFWDNFEEQMIELPKCFAQFLLKTN